MAVLSKSVPRVQSLNCIQRAWHRIASEIARAITAFCFVCAIYLLLAEQAQRFLIAT